MPKRTVVCLRPERDAGHLIIDLMYAGIRKAAMKARCAAVCADTAECAAALCKEHGERVVIVLSSSRSECRHFAAVLGRSGLHPLFGNMEFSDPGYRHSSVSPDFFGMAYRLTSLLCSHGITRPVFLGWNPDSCHDALRLNGTDAACAEHALVCERIEYRGGLSETVDAFLSQKNRYDSVICANDFTAQVLLDRLSDSCGIPIVSLGGMQSFEGRVLCASVDYEAVGRQLFDTAWFLTRQSFAADVNVRIPALIDADLHLPAVNDREPAPDYYRDETVSAIGRVERILNSASREDLTILPLLIENHTYETIAEQTFMSVRTVKNHAKKLYRLAECASKKEFVALFRMRGQKVQ